MANEAPPPRLLSRLLSSPPSVHVRFKPPTLRSLPPRGLWGPAVQVRESLRRPTHSALTLALAHFGYESRLKLAESLRTARATDAAAL